MTPDPLFLTLAEIVDIHADQIERYGGSSGIRDVTLLDSAIAIPQAGFGDQYLHQDIFQMAAAYLYHIVQNHPFVDGNKRAAFLAVGLFLGLNDFRLAADQVDAARNMLALAAGEINEEQFATWVRAHMKRGARRGRGST